MAEFDVVIIGGGPAGLTAALYAARANMSHMLFDQKGLGGEIMNTDLVEDYPGFATTTGRDLAEKMAEHAEKFGMKHELKGVKKIATDGDRKRIEMVDGTVHYALAVVIAAGGEPVKLGVPGEKEFYGKGVSYCAVCDGAFFKGSDLAVVGGGDSAVQEGLFLTRFAKKLHVVHRRSEFRAQAILQDRLFTMDKVEKVTPATVKEIGGENVVQWIDVVQDGTTRRIPLDGVFIFVGFTPLGRELFTDEHIEHDEGGYIITDQNMRTNIPGVYAAGDCRAQLFRQVTTAVGDATTAILHAERYIEELRHAKKTFPMASGEVIAETASAMEVVRFQPGATIVKEGDPTDRFYLVAKGDVEVVHQGKVLKSLRSGEYFGEVGLLTGAPRNATVRAKTSVELLAMDKAAFDRMLKQSAETRDAIASVAATRDV